MKDINELIVKYPKIFQDYPGNPGRVNWDCPTGWLDMVDSHLEKMQNYIGDNEDLQINCTQIKEKFAGLRFYYAGGDNAISDIIINMEKKSDKTCQNCGSTVDVSTIKISGWLTTLCLKCQ